MTMFGMRKKAEKEIFKVTMIDQFGHVHHCYDNVYRIGKRGGCLDEYKLYDVNDDLMVKISRFHCHVVHITDRRPYKEVAAPEPITEKETKMKRETPEKIVEKIVEKEVIVEKTPEKVCVYDIEVVDAGGETYTHKNVTYMSMGDGGLTFGIQEEYLKYNWRMSELNRWDYQCVGGYPAGQWVRFQRVNIRWMYPCDVANLPDR